MKELSILGGATESFVMLYDKALLQVDGAGRYDVQASLDGEHWSVLTPITAKCDHHSRTIVLDLLAGAHIRVVCVTGAMESARYSFDMGETSEAERIAAEEARVEAENKRVEAENEREVAEAARDAAEAQRVAVFNSNEEQRKKGEASREVAEAARVTSENARAKAEQGRASAEAVRADAENLRKSAESSRVTAESARVSSEGVRVNAENQRKSVETSRVNAEAARANAETNRVSTEASRVNAEKERATAEGVREDNEQARVLAEAERVEAEAKREERTDEAIASIANKVDRTDNAPELTSGFAGNLVGRGEATEELIGFRPSGGLTSVDDGAARIERLKGNTVVWNQKLDTPGLIRWPEAAGNIIINNDGKKVEVTNTAYEGTAGDVIAIYSDVSYNKTVTGHKILCILDFQSSSTNISGPSIEYGSFTCQLTKLNLNTYYGIYTTTKISSYMVLKVAGTKAIGDTWSFSNIQVHDLTQMFGAGNEPTTIEEFNARKPLGIDEYAYNEGELISTTADEIKSVGFNAWDGQLKAGYLNGDGFTIGDKSSSHTLNFVKVIPGATYYKTKTNVNQTSFYDRNKSFLVGKWLNRGEFTIPNDCHFIKVDFPTADADSFCINLAHTGYRNGEYEPYEEFRRSLPISEIKDSDGNALFPNGLLSAGSVYDEITATKAIKRIGAREYQEGDIVTDGTTTYYELAEPIEVDLEEPLNLDYEVSDFGTEEVISDTPTAPLKADIIYQFNAVDRIRENSLSLEDLIKRVAALEAQNAALVQQLNATDNGEAE